MIDNRIDIAQAAASWHVRRASMSDTDWVSFVEWLEADPAHAAAYDSLALDDAALGEVPCLLPPVPVEAAQVVPAVLPIRQWGRRALLVGGGLAIAASAVFLVPSALVPASVTYATASGETRVVRLADGSSVDLSGGTRLVVGPRVATLETGEALFHVRHNPARPFTVTSGGLTLQDVGTVFDAARDGQRLDVQVAQGAVMFQPGREKVLRGAGAALTVRQDEGIVSRSKVAIDQVGGWRAGRLSFDNEPLARVASTMHRVGGYDLGVSPSLSARPFTGTIRFSGTADRDVPRMANLIGAKWHKDGARWILSMPGDAQ